MTTNCPNCSWFDHDGTLKKLLRDTKDRQAAVVVVFITHLQMERHLSKKPPHVTEGESRVITINRLTRGLQAGICIAGSIPYTVRRTCHTCSKFDHCKQQCTLPLVHLLSLSATALKQWPMIWLCSSQTRLQPYASPSILRRACPSSFGYGPESCCTTSSRVAGFNSLQQQTQQSADVHAGQVAP
jgi:hypothetical protein